MKAPDGSPRNEIQIESVKLTGKPAELVVTLLGGLASQPAEKIGEVAGNLIDLVGVPIAVLASKVRAWRDRNLAAVAQRASELLEERKIEPKPLPLPFVLDALGGASQAENPDIREMWAHLLASGVESEQSQRRIFVRLLSDLEPADARLLKRMASSEPEKIHAWDVPGGWPDVVSDFDSGDQQSFSILLSLGICRSSHDQAHPGYHPLLKPLGVQFARAVGVMPTEMETES